MNFENKIIIRNSDLKEMLLGVMELIPLVEDVKDVNINTLLDYLEAHPSQVCQQIFINEKR